MTGYRKDIDGLRGIAVIAVILFHLKLTSNGYLGVDVFFVISGFLISGIIYKELLNGQFSLKDFYLRRIRRIMPLTLTTTTISLLVGIFIMLPDDLENLSQSVVATLFFSNNILQYLTTGDYWATFNDYKPLMHTWSLGVEEQYYLIYPLLFMLIGLHRQLMIIVLLSLGSLSLLLFIFTHSENARFYLIQYRFFELALGGLAAIASSTFRVSSWLRSIALISLGLLLFSIVPLSHQQKLASTTLATTLLVLPPRKDSLLLDSLLKNRLIQGLGLISFSLYMWHQVLIAFLRYAWVEEISNPYTLSLLILTVFFSVLSYLFIEQPFRNRTKVNNRTLLVSLGTLFVMSSITALYLVNIGGITRDVPELGLMKSDGKNNEPFGRQIVEKHREYNERIYEFDKDFTNTQNLKILIVGNSFARDWANILLESDFRDRFEISYSPDSSALRARSYGADMIFVEGMHRYEVKSFGVPEMQTNSRIWNIGPKQFGFSNGIFYRQKKQTGYCYQRATVPDALISTNDSLSNEWGDQYINLLDTLMDTHKTMPVFTKECEFISWDCRHLTTAGAKFIASKINMQGLIDKVRH